METIELNKNIGKAKSGVYKLTRKFPHDEYDTLFYSLALKSGKLSTALKNKIILNSTINKNAPSICQLDKLIELGRITIK